MLLIEPIDFDKTSPDALFKHITQLKTESDKVLKGIRTLQSAPPISLRDKLTDPEWLFAEQEKLREQKESLLVEKNYLTAVRASLWRENE